MPSVGSAPLRLDAGWWPTTTRPTCSRRRSARLLPRASSPIRSPSCATSVLRTEAATRYRGPSTGVGVNGVRFARAVAAWLGLAVGWCLVVPVAAAADSRARAIDQFYHTAWTVREGAPGQVTALAQTSDGYLWLGTQTGLYRFDGVTFEHYRPREGGDFLASSVASLYAPPSG